ncbi:MAG: hypothetical protein AAB658_14700 [Chloroflexota bacterium]
MSSIKSEEYEAIYSGFEAAISRYDCGQYCAPHNGGEPVCCSTKNAIPVATVEEWKFLKSRTDLWHIYQPNTKAERKIKDELPHDCRVLECKGAAFCERHNRTLSCRTFPFFPYITKGYEFVGLAYYWHFEDKCWVMSNLQVVEREFVREFVSTFELLFRKVPGELEVFRDHSASQRRAFSRWKRNIPLIGRDGGYFEVVPNTGETRPAKVEDFLKHGPYK